MIAGRKEGIACTALIGVVGMLTMMGLAYLFSTNRRAIRGKTVAWGLGLQIVFAFLVMRWEFGRWLFQQAGAGVNWLLDFAFYGSAFVFGDSRQTKVRRIGFLFRVPGAADDHLHRGVFRAALLLRRHAVHHQASRRG